MAGNVVYLQMHTLAFIIVMCRNVYQWDENVGFVGRDRVQQLENLGLIMFYKYLFVQ